jgi:hypothetical protein
MKVRELMTSEVRTCRAETSPADPVRDMWEGVAEPCPL